MNRKSVVLFVLLVIVNTAVCFSAEVKTVAVADFGARNATATDAIIISDFLRSELVRGKYFQVIDRTNMEKVLEEQKFQATGCTEQQCAVAMGKILNVELMIVGAYSKFEDVRYVTVDVIDVATGQIVVSEKVKFKEAKNLDRLISSLADKLAKNVYKAKFYDIRRMERWHGIGIHGGPLIGRGSGGGGELYYFYVKDSGVGLQLNMGIFTQTSWNTMTYFSPIVVTYCLYPDKAVMPYIGVGACGYFGEGGGIGLLLNGGVNIALSRKLRFNLDIKDFSVNSMAAPNSAAISTGIAYMLD
jgi:hypothetical protein